MLTYCKKIWHDPVWSKVIAAVIIGFFGLYFSPWWQNIKSFIAGIFSYSLQDSSVTNWQLWLMSACSLLVALVILVVVWQTLFPTSPVSIKPEWKIKYTEDLFFNVRWRWRYSADNQVVSITTYCPKCDLQIYASDTSSYGAVPKISFICEICNKQSQEVQGTYSELENKVGRFIHQKIRNKTWNSI